MKKYTEFPYHGYQTREEVFDFILGQLENAYKVELDLNEFEINQSICDSSVFISEYFLETKRVGFYCWESRGMNYYEKDRDDFFERLIEPSIQKESKFLESRNLISVYDDMFSLNQDIVKSGYLPKIISHYNILIRKMIATIS